MESNLEIYNWVAYRGDDMTVNVNFRDTDGTPIDITGWTVFFTLKRKKDDADSEAVVAKTISGFQTPETGVAVITVSHTELNDLLGPYFYDFQFVNATGIVQTMTSGTITFEKDITRRIA